MGYNVVLHVGAHRTGTTSLQAALDSAAGALLDQGIVALTPPRPGKRDTLTGRALTRLLVSAKSPIGRLFVSGKRHKAEALLGSLVEQAAGPASRIERLIVSDEGLLGRAIMGNGNAIYNHARAHLLSLKAVFPRRVDEIHMTMRSYDRFIVSAYAMRAVYSGKMKPFAAIRDRLVNPTNRWPDVVRDMHGVFPDCRIILSMVEKDDLESRLRSLAGPGCAAMDLAGHLPDKLNQAPSLEAIEYVVQSQKKPADADAIVARFSDGTVFDPLEPAEKERLSQLYADDIRQIKSIDYVEWLGS